MSSLDLLVASTLDGVVSPPVVVPDVPGVVFLELLASGTIGANIVPQGELTVWLEPGES